MACVHMDLTYTWAWAEIFLNSHLKLKILNYLLKNIIPYQITPIILIGEWEKTEALQLPTTNKSHGGRAILRHIIFPLRHHLQTISAVSALPLQKRRRGGGGGSKVPSSSNGGVVSVRAYMEDSNSVSGFARKVIGSLPVVGLLARIVSDEGGLGGDIIDFAEFRRRVGKKCSINDSRAFYEFQDRRGRSGDPLYVLLCCWLAAVGAGLLKSEEILEGVARLRLSNDIEFEEENFISMMNEAREKRAKLKAPPPTVPMEIRAEKALEAIRVCCLGKDPIEEEDERLLCVMLNAVFPSVGKAEIARIVKDKVRRVAEGSEADLVPEPKRLSKEAVQLQMKDLQFLKQKSET
ncbi:photosystem I assembly factor PSA3, chloroplastic [Diospyros lotus]|uniref:photosystem I assembly factor PSA3, chloroplastic n=1 Tax=Diospyros lotus TaxID=55363 RepID=UPI0022590F76|nr:photosystem I assembly factor PSA3, chloroplastic [Diospyros lotus]